MSRKVKPPPATRISGPSVIASDWRKPTLDAPRARLTAEEIQRFYQEMQDLNIIENQLKRICDSQK